MFSTENVTVLLAGAGAGKTTYLIGEIQNDLVHYTPEDIAFVSYTRKGAYEGRDRLLAKVDFDMDRFEYFRTLHSMCFHALRLSADNLFTPKRARHFNSVLGFKLTTGANKEYTTVDDRMLSHYDIQRAGHFDPYTEIDGFDDVRYERLIRAYETYKKEYGLFDFTDCLVEFVKRDIPLPVKVAYIDEVQDLTALHWEVCKVAFRNVEKVTVAGDDYQCQPTGSKVLTNEGYVNIERLTSRSNLIVYAQADSAFYGFKRRGYKAKVARNNYCGDLINVKTVDAVNRFTPNHKMIVKMNHCDTSIRCVYLMRKGSDYRVGQCQMFNKDGYTHVATRMRLERADAVWILEVCKDKKETKVLEQIVACEYGLPQICFNDNDIADEVYSRLETEEKAKKLLKSRGLLFEHPFLDDATLVSRKYGSTIIECVACNLIPEVMLLPKYSGSSKHVDWVNFTLSKSKYSGYVYSLDVEKYHTYITDGGIATHNSIFSYAGAKPQVLIDLSEKHKTIKLETSYRLPQKAYRLAKAITDILGKKVDKDYKPFKEDEGVVEEVNDWNVMASIVKHNQNKKWLLLFRTNSVAAQFEKILQQNLILYNNSKGFCIGQDRLTLIKKYYSFRKLGYKNEAEKAKFLALYGLESLDKEMTETGIFKNDEAEIIQAYIDAYGVEGMLKKAKDTAPNILVSTIHKIKGGEAWNVAVFLDSSIKVERNRYRDFDSELRLLYVAVTRTQQNLYLVASTGQYGYDDIISVLKEHNGL